MTGREPHGSDWVGALSDGAAPAAAPAAAAPPGPRYRLGGELGVGAMGRVRAAYDTLLEREVAVKQVRAADDGRAEAALLREAKVTAGLDHPGIIAVLDAGEDADGQRFYVMRVVHGQSLAEVVAAGPDAAARTALVRALLQAVQAMAYAHARGVVHRDLSPRNVRIGAHGEVVVMDWGLAATVADADRGGVVCGTPDYRSPELTRGEPAGPASDVWSLGALLHLVLTGSPPGAALPRRGLRPELRSLLARALAPRPAARYADAGALARDLVAFLDGGRVAAHRDRPWDRSARLARRHPGALAAGAAGLAAAAVVAGVLGTLATRRADEARRSRAAARAALRVMVEDRAHAAVRADRRPTATADATAARALGAEAAAAGVEAAFAASPAVTVRPLGDEAGCRTLAMRHADERLCVADRRLWWLAGAARQALDLGGIEPTTARFLADGGAVAVAAGPGGNHVVRFDAARAAVGRHTMTGGAPSIDEAAGWAIVGAAEHYLAIAPDGSARSIRPCAAGVALRLVAAHPAATPAAAATVVWCGDGTLVTSGPGGVTRLRTPELDARLPGASAGVVLGGRLVIGGADARVGVVDLGSGQVVHVSASPVGPVARLAAGLAGDVIVVGADGVGLWRPELGAWRHVAAAEDATDAGPVDGRIVAFGAATLAAWEVGPGAGTHRVTARAGLAAVAWSPDGALVAFGGGAGVVDVLAPRTGHLRRLTVTDQVVKSLAFGPDGRTLAVGVATDAGLRVLALDTGAEQPGAWLVPELRVRRLGFLSDQTLLVLGYGAQVFRVDVTGGPPRAVAGAPGPFVDASPGPGPLFALGADGRLWRYAPDAPDAPAPRRAAPDAAAVATSGDGRVLALVTAAGHIELRDAASDAGLAPLDAPGARVEDAALDHRGARLALARLDGTVEIWDVAGRRPVVTVRAHAGRAAAVAFAPDGCTLATAGWDGVGRLLALCAP